MKSFFLLKGLKFLEVQTNTFLNIRSLYGSWISSKEYAVCLDYNELRKSKTNCQFFSSSYFGFSSQFRFALLLCLLQNLRNGFRRTIVQLSALWIRKDLDGRVKNLQIWISAKKNVQNSVFFQKFRMSFCIYKFKYKKRNIRLSLKTRRQNANFSTLSGESRFVNSECTKPM